MKTVTDDFVHSQKKSGAVVVRAVYYKRRYWDQDTSEYIWETSWTQLDEDQIQMVSPVTWNLDNITLNEFKVANVTLNVDNLENQWSQDNQAGYFGLDSASPVWGYEPYWMKFKVSIGYELEDGTNELVDIFTGLATEYTMNTTRKTCQILVEGLEALLQNTKAEDIATTVTNENKGVGNSSNTDFTTTNPGVGGILEVSLNGIKQRQGDDYTISQLNDASQGAKITFATAPTAAETIRISYFYWPQNNDFEDIVTLLLDAAGIASGSQAVEDVIFEGNVLNAQTFTDQPDFDVGTLTDMLSSEDPGYLQPDWGATSFKESQTWSTSDSGWTYTTNGGATLASDATQLVYTDAGVGGLCRAVRPFDRQIGWFEFKYQFATTGTGTQRITFAVGPNNDGSKGSFGFRALIHPTSITVEGSQSDTFSFASGTSYRTFKVVFYGLSAKIYVDGTLMSTIVTFAPNVVYFVLQFQAINGVYKVKDIVTPKSSVTCEWSSAIIDATTTPSAFGAFSYTDEDGDGFADLVYSTRTSADGISFDSWVEIPASNIPQSTLKRYIQLKAVFTIPTVGFFSAVTLTSDLGDVFVDEMVLRFTTSSTSISLPVFTGLSVYEAIQKLGEYTNYEFGFKPDETFFFRPRAFGNSVMTLNHDDYNGDVLSMTTGLDRTYGSVRAVYGDYSAEINDDAAHPKSPTARTKNRRFEIQPDSSIQIPATADIATGVANNFFPFLSKNRRRVKLRTKMVPQIDLADVVTLNFKDNSPDVVWYLGDQEHYLGEDLIHLWGEGEQILSGFRAKVIGARYDTERHVSEFDLEEAV